MKLSNLALLTIALLSSAPALAEMRIPDITEQRNAAVGYALTADLLTNSLAATCAQLGGDLQQSAKDARAGWKSRNWHLVDSSHQYLLWVRAVFAREKGEEAALNFFKAQLTEFDRQTMAALQDIFADGKPEPEACASIVRSLDSGDFDFAQKSEFYEDLQSIASDMTAFSAK